MQGPPTPANYSALLTANLDLLASPTREGPYCAQSHLSPCAHQQFRCLRRCVDVCVLSRQTCAVEDAGVPVYLDTLSANWLLWRKPLRLSAVALAFKPAMATP